MADDNSIVYCICKQPYDPEQFMIECDVCKDWFHGSCVNVQEHESYDIDVYHCVECQKTHGLPKMKPMHNYHRHNYADPSENSKVVQSGTAIFVHNLKTRRFFNADEIVCRYRGSDMTLARLKAQGFSQPIIVDNQEGLGLVVPNDSFDILDVKQLVGADRELDVIDVARQSDSKMKLVDWTNYLLNPSRTKVMNVISLEFSDTPLADLVTAPKCVTDLDWVSLYWPTDQLDECTHVKPVVQKYCLMSAKDSYTDFHIDFGGTSVWYHVLKGEKIFYLVCPSDRNLKAYCNWIRQPTSSEQFFGNLADRCYKLTLKTGQTLFIPTGWIHAVLTPVDSLVFGGNFLHKLNIQLQLRIYEMECWLNVPNKFRHPSYETLNWYAAQHLLEDLKGLYDCGEAAPSYLLNGLEAMAEAFQRWTRTEDNAGTDSAQHRDQIPDAISPGLFIKDIRRQLKYAYKLQERARVPRPHSSPLKMTIPKSVTSSWKSGLDAPLQMKRKRNSPIKSGMKLSLTNGKIVKKSRVEQSDGDGDEQLPLTLKLVGYPRGGQVVRIKKSSDGEDVDVEDESVSSVMQLHTSDTQMGERRTSAIQRDDNFVYGTDNADVEATDTALAKQARLSNDKAWNPKGKRHESTHSLSQPITDPSYNPVKHLQSTKQRRPKKGLGTAKQRLGRILKLDRTGRL
ncbi:lysine-specific demethylase 7A-like isoform X2 [Corticium candelabrum]|uniref:lysine-specific demethylase 7A-like isoform X2 n=1 Tax=Corticium candelabrum TaxID=121492 RepID=UPI002E25F43A|nr:lysine-specific demethylase 7A-like isoform X2 [Corticium candelabrum]